ncbi:helix-turn-helix transcriptional regulator [Acinetobacter rudis]|uniref:Helix-turn-helix domain-containing protein n=1 Tax=Acinetobacter rudis CIP 110305 TaxID=421052 RepID=S3N9A5_9GAMM|nr:hypothetical protein [Acinetobacter rudis]EPF74988.1 hypothetical protein F945_01359 [Acinetobacter rudis CIP 110305]
MRTEQENKLLQAIFNEMQLIKKAVAVQDERRVSVKEFAKRLGFSEPTLWDRIKDGIIEKPQQDGRRVFWLNSYVNFAVQHCKKSDTVAA